jgi:tetratricopeptide (TPR) repeat protein
LDNLEYIDSYFSGEQSAEETKKFEERVIEEPGFAEEVAFYLSAKQLAREQQTKIPGANEGRFKELYTKYKSDNEPGTREKFGRTRKLWTIAAAAAIITAIVLGVITWPRSSSPEQLADRYIKEHFEKMPVSMGNAKDSLQKGKDLFNDGKLNEALLQFESIIQNDSTSFEAKKFAGIVSLQIKKYDKAISYFSQLENYPDLYANPGKFYHALTLIKRNQPGDKQEAKSLLELVVRNDLEGKTTAEDWLKKW